MTAQYATVRELVDFLNALGNTIDRSSNTVLEVVGTGDGTKTKFVLSNPAVLSNTYSVYYGSTETEALGQELTEE